MPQISPGRAVSSIGVVFKGELQQGGHRFAPFN